LIGRLSQTDRRSIREVWKQLGIWSEVFERDDEIHLSVKDIDVGGTAGRLLLISLANSSEWSWQYLLFRREEAKWRFLGNIDCDRQRYSPPEFRIQRIGDKGVWFVLRYMMGGGSGVADYWETWYDLAGNRRQSVLDYPEHGHMSGWGVPYGYEYELKEVSARPKGEEYVVDLSIDVTFSNADIDIGDVALLFEKRFKAHYVWDARTARFRFDRSRSDVSEDRFQRGFAFTFTLSPDDFLRAYSNDLRKLTRKPGPGLRLWLLRFLEMCSQSNEKRALLKELNFRVRPRKFE
jgi:hypothetical protein